MKYDENGNIDQKYYDNMSDKQKIHKGVWYAIVAGVVVVLLVLGWYFFVYASAEGRGRVALHNQQRDPQELKFNLEDFQGTCRAIIADTQNIQQIQNQLDDMQSHPPANDPFGQNQSAIQQVRNNLSDTIQSRNNHAAHYNAISHEFTRNFIKSKDLPDEIGPPTGTSYESLQCHGHT